MAKNQWRKEVWRNVDKGVLNKIVQLDNDGVMRKDIIKILNENKDHSPTGGIWYDSYLSKVLISMGRRKHGRGRKRPTVKKTYVEKASRPKASAMIDLAEDILTSNLSVNSKEILLRKVIDVR